MKHHQMTALCHDRANTSFLCGYFRFYYLLICRNLLYWCYTNKSCVPLSYSINKHEYQHNSYAPLAAHYHLMTTNKYKTVQFPTYPTKLAERRTRLKYIQRLTVIKHNDTDVSYFW